MALPTILNRAGGMSGYVPEPVVSMAGGQSGYTPLMGPPSMQRASDIQGIPYNPLAINNRAGGMSGYTPVNTSVVSRAGGQSGVDPINTQNMIKAIDVQIADLESQLPTLKQKMDEAYAAQNSDVYKKLAEEQNKYNLIGDIAQSDAASAAQLLGLGSSSTKNLKGSPAAQEAYNKFQSKLTDLYAAKADGNLEDSSKVIDIYKGLGEASSEYFRASGGDKLTIPSYSAITNAEANAAKARKAEIDIAKGEQDIEKKKIEIGQMGSAEKQRLVDKYTAQVDKVMSDRREAVKGYSSFKKALAILNNIKGASNPETLALAVKAFGQMIEPGLAVTDGEARLFMGANAATEAINIAKAIGAGFEALKNKVLGNKSGTMDDLQKAVATGNASIVKAIKDYASGTVGTKLTKIAKTAVTGGAEHIRNSNKAMFDIIYKDTIDENERKALISEMDNIFYNRLYGGIGEGKDLAPEQTPSVTDNKNLRGDSGVEARGTKNPPKTRKTSQSNDPFGLL